MTVGESVTRSANALATIPLAVVLSLIACVPTDADRSIAERGPLARGTDTTVVQRTDEEFGAGRAVLADGPYRRTGLDALGSNVISVWRGDYNLFMESGHAAVTVEYVDRPVNLPAWDRIMCEQLSLLVAPPGDETIVYARAEGDGRTFFFTFASTVDAPCRFVARFLSEYEFFRGAVEAGSVPPFPAILDVS